MKKIASRVKPPNGEGWWFYHYYEVLKYHIQFHKKVSYPIFGLSKYTANLRLSGLIVLECPLNKYLL